MRKAIWLGIAAGALALGLAATSTAAAPIGGVALQATEPASLVEKVHCRRFWNGYRWRCSWRHHHARFFFGARPFFGFHHRPFYFRRHAFHHHHYHRRFRPGFFVGFGF
jgi:hypothetical protein